MAKGRPFSIRLSEPTDRFVEAEARRTKRSKSAIVESLAEEAARIRRFPGIGFREDDPIRRAWVMGTGLDVWELVMLLRDFGSAERVLDAFPNLTRAHVRIGLAYYEAYPREIDEALAENDRPMEELLELYPFIEDRSSGAGRRSQSA
jgi:uncharacterized protein (DUF433 family)